MHRMFLNNSCFAYIFKNQTNLSRNFGQYLYCLIKNGKWGELNSDVFDY